jgi:hypothetical protein
LTKLETLEKSKMKRREALTRILNSISDVSLSINKKNNMRIHFSFLKDNQMSKEMKQERLEKMIRDELEENNSDRQTPIQSLLPTTTTPPGAPGNGQQDRSPRQFSPTSSGGRLQY